MKIRRRNPDKRPRRRTERIYREELKLLRKYYTGFEARNGFNARRLSEGARRLIRKLEPQIKQLKALQTYTRKEVRGRTKRQQEQLQKFASAPPGSLDYGVVTYRTVGKGKKKRRRKVVRKVKPRPKIVPVFTTDKKAKVGITKDGALQVTEHGHDRDVYPIDRIAFNADPFGYMRAFIKKHNAKRVMINVGANVIGEVYSEWDFVDEPERLRRLAENALKPVEERISIPQPNAGKFVNMVDSYRRAGAGRAEYFLSNIMGISILKGGHDARYQTFAKTVRDSRLALKAARKAMTKHKRVTMK